VKRDKIRIKRHCCQVCGATGVTQIHHIFGGALRKISEKHDFVIELCPSCHERAHRDADFSFVLKRNCQMRFLQDHDIDEWMALVHRSWVYLRDIPERKKNKPVPDDGPGRFDDEEDINGADQSAG